MKKKNKIKLQDDNNTNIAKKNAGFKDEIIDSKKDNSEKIIESIKEKISFAKKELKNVELRHQANLLNYEKDLNQETSLIKEITLEDFFKDFLGIVFSLENILKQAKNLDFLEDAVVSGILLTKKLLLTCLEQYGLKILTEKINVAFNKEKHEVCKYIKSKNPNEKGIASVVAKGYGYKNKILKRVLVNVFKK